MGLFNQTFLIGAKDGSRLEEVTTLIDTGSIYTMLPAPLLHRVGVVAEWSSEFELAHGHEVEYDLGEFRCVLSGQERTNVCIFGPPDCQPLLGTNTLQSFGLMADPVNQGLVPARLFIG